MGYNKKQSKLIKRTFTPDRDISREIKLVGKEIKMIYDLVMFAS